MKRPLPALALTAALVLAQSVPVQAAAEQPEITSISAGDYHVLAVDSNRGLWAWGWNEKGQLGDLALDNSGGDAEGPYLTRPAKVMEDVVSVSTGLWTSAAVRTDGSLWTWGNGAPPGKLMDGVKAVTLDRDRVGGATVTEDGGLWIWGEGPLEQLGLGPSAVPVKVMEGVADACIGADCLMVLKDDGTLESIHDEGTEPVQVLEQVKKVAVRQDIWWAVKTDGTLWQWPLYGTPAQAMGNVLDADVGHGGAAYIVKTDGTLWAVGANSFGQLGNGTVGVSAEEPVQVLTGVARVAAGDCFAVALKTDGTVWSWGTNGNGQLGNGGKGDGASLIGPTQSVPDQVIFTPAEGGLTAYPGVAFAIMVDGGWEHMSLYGLENERGDRSYYVRLRDVAASLAETPAAFGVAYDADGGVIHLTTGERYLSQTGDGALPFAGEQAARREASRVTLDGIPMELDSITLTDSAGGGHTYVKLRDLGRAMDFGVRWDSGYHHEFLDVSGRILIETDKPYTED